MTKSLNIKNTKLLTWRKIDIIYYDMLKCWIKIIQNIQRFWYFTEADHQIFLSQYKQNNWPSYSDLTNLRWPPSAILEFRIKCVLIIPQQSAFNPKKGNPRLDISTNLCTKFVKIFLIGREYLPPKLATWRLNSTAGSNIDTCVELSWKIDLVVKGLTPFQDTGRLIVSCNRCCDHHTPYVKGT